MPSLTAVYNPTLESVLMVENAIRKHSGDVGKHQLWKLLPRQMMYQPYQVILAYLVQSGKIIVDKKGKVHWTYDPKGMKKVLTRSVRLR